MNHVTKSSRSPSGVKPGSILRAMGAATEAVSPRAFEPQHLEAGAAHTDHGPSIEVERDGDRVTRIIARCACGEVITIDCAYPEARRPAAS